MRKWKTILTLALSAVMCLSLLAGCGGGGGDSGSGSVYWLNFKPESDEALQTVAKMYTEATGVPVKVVTAASGTYNQTLNSEMDKSNDPPPVKRTAKKYKDFSQYGRYAVLWQLEIRVAAGREPEFPVFVRPQSKAGVSP